MKELTLVLWLVWQSITAPFYPDPSVIARKAYEWVSTTVKLGDQLSVDLKDALRREGFVAVKLGSADQQAILGTQPWRSAHAVRLYYCGKTIPLRPAIGVKTFSVMIGVDGRGAIVHRDIVVLRADL